MTPQNTYSTGLARFSQVGALLVACMGAAVLVGWHFDIALLKSGLAGLDNMKANTALAFLAAGVAIWSLHSSAPKIRMLSLPLSIVVTALGGLTLVEDLFALNLGIDQLLFLDAVQPSQTASPGRMATTTALSFFLIGIALLVLRTPRPSLLWGRVHWFVLPPLFISTVALVGYAYGVRSLYQLGPFIPMAANTALSFFVLSLSILAANPAKGIAAVFVSETAGGMLARRLLPTLSFVIFGLGWMLLAGDRTGYYDSRFRFALMVVLSIAVSVFAIASTAVRLHTVDIKRKKAEAEIMTLNEELERRVQERTRELEMTLAQVKQLTGLLPICAWCKKIRDDQDYWHSVEQYVTTRTDARFSHGICPDCDANLETRSNLAKLAES